MRVGLWVLVGCSGPGGRQSVGEGRLAGRAGGYLWLPVCCFLSSSFVPMASRGHERTTEDYGVSGFTGCR